MGIPIANDLGSRISSIAAPDGSSWVVPVIVTSSGISIGGAMEGFFYPYKTTQRWTRTLSLNGLRAFTSGADALAALSAFANVGSWSVGVGNNMACLTADGRQLTLYGSRYTGGGISIVDMGGSLYWNISSNHCGSTMTLTDSTVLPANQKPNAGVAPVAVTPSVPLPISIMFSDPVSHWNLILGNQYGSGDEMYCNFYVTSLNVSLVSLELDNYSLFMPFGLELWACTPVAGDPASYPLPTTIAEQVLARGGAPLTMTPELQVMLGVTPNWALYGITPGPAVGVNNASMYWQAGTATGELYGKVSVSVQGYFVEPQEAMLLWNQIHSMESGTIDFLDPETEESFRTFTYAAVSSHSVNDNMGVVNGKPVITATITFEGYTTFLV